MTKLQETINAYEAGEKEKAYAIYLSDTSSNGASFEAFLMHFDKVIENRINAVNTIVAY
jgi:hypothetical protein